ncbi:MAG: dienelactone hydrolase family protein [Deltaproteobacteria bacterium]|nr:dienelactone hydrolase family protein [Deltaproteobacteria bacterium]
MARAVCAFACLLLLCSGAAWAAHPGFRTIGIWSDEDRVRLDLCVWYPVRHPPATVRYGGWLLQVNRRATPLEGPFPLVIISHGSPGNRFAHHNLAASLAGQGFVVVAPTHQEDNAHNMRHLYTARQLTRRLDEIRQTIAKICVEPEIGPLIDPNRIGLIGFDSGGAAALLSIGGRISPAAWEQWKADAPPDAPYLYPWAKPRLDALAADPSLHHLHAYNRIRCAIVAAPAYSMLFDPASLARIQAPVMLLATEQDPINPAPHRLRTLRDKLPLPPDMALIRGADPIALMARPEGRSVDVLPGYADPGAKQRQQIFDQLNSAVSGFFLRTIGNPNLPPLAPPLPDDAGEIKPEPAKDAGQRKQ